MISENVKKLVVKTGVTIVISASVIGFTSSKLKPNYLSNIREAYAEERLSDTQTTTNNLNLRRGAGTNFGILLTIPKGEVVKVDSSSGSWSKVVYKGKTGYVNNNYLKGEINDSNYGGSETLYNLNLRRGAGINHGILLTIPKGGKVEVLSTSGSWSKVNYKGTTGFVSSQYLKVTEKPADKPVEKPEEKPETPPAETPSNGNGETLYNLNLRRGAGTSHGILLTIPKGEKVEVLSTSGSWSKVKYKGTTGFVSSQYLKVTGKPVEKPETPPVETPSNGNGETLYNLNLRRGAGTSHGILLTIPKGEKVEVLSTSGSWSKVKYKDTVGFVSSQYLKVTGKPADKPVEKPEEKPETPPAETPSNGNGETLYNLNLRRGAGTSHGILLTIPKGGKVEVLSTSGSWSKVNYKGTVGFVSSQYLKVTEKPADKPVEKPETPPVDSPSNSEGETLYNLNLRKGAGTNYGILLTIPKGGKVEVLSTSGSWSKVNYKGTVGFVSSQYLKVAQETPDSGAGGDEVIETPEHLDGKLKLDVLKNSYNNENVTVTGYAAFSSGLRTVNIFLNNRLQGSAKLNLNRKDLENSKSGFSYTIPSNSVFPGNNALRVEIYETNGKKHILDSTIKMTKTPTIVVDAGHGGSDSGASGYLNGNKIMEKTYTLDIALLLDQELKSRGINSILTRSSDVYVGLSQRANVANNAKADLLVSIHHDYSSGPGPNGAFVMYPSYKNNSVSMSTISESIEVSNKLKQSFLDLGFANRRNGPDTSISGKSLAVLRQTEMRSVLAEIGFISNPSDAAKLNDKVLQKALAKRMAEQLASYFGM